MDRVETLLQKLQQQFKDGASPAQLLLTVQMMQHELMHLQTSGGVSESVSVSMPVGVNPEPIQQPATPVEEERTVEVLQVNEEEIEAELEEIKRNAANIQQITVHSKPQLLFESIDEEAPTLRQHSNQSQPEKKEINQAVAKESVSVNDVLKIEKIELSEKLTDAPVKDLKKAIGVNDRFLYINELFRGDEAMYERSIKTINSFSIWPEAEYWIRRELKTKLGWSDSQETVKQFDQLVKRRFL
ncbi:hypothetical protein LK994_07495 [Ferruginibacter lapsinanis]|uniref:hypothetical protein n=1 Tax=Ferruginibacter lapsinanis TaxID=563172 RepID=UPI001E61EFAD|nr:hypothetical protein [Ferruginibacter lapsinanis]UEG51313.1 hypothetical protein LK994_07495 [Ferruginibacter lapsinanis]